MNDSQASLSPVTPKTYVGIDVSKKAWDVHVASDGKSLKCDADDAG